MSALRQRTHDPGKLVEIRETFMSGCTEMMAAISRELQLLQAIAVEAQAVAETGGRHRVPQHMN